MVNISNSFFKRVNIAPLIVFRIVFGALMLFGTFRFVLKGWVSELYIEPQFHFTYLGFDWVKILPGNWMFLPFVLMIFASIGLILGVVYRLSAIIFFICFTYVELIDKTYYLNHYYFVSLIAFLLIFLPANKNFSIDSNRKPEISTNFVSAWTIWILKFQLICVYFYAGLAKINYDWLLQAQPLKTWLQAYRDLPYIGWIFTLNSTAFIFSWVGCIYDLSIPFFLSFSKTRKYAYFFVIIFHLLTWALFPIGIFPWVMIFSTLIFFSNNFHQKVLLFLSKFLKVRENSGNFVRKSKDKVLIIFISIYIFIQVIVPFRYLLYRGNLFWSEEGMRFSWRVMVMHKEGFSTFYLKDKKTGGEIEIDNSKFLTATQIDQMSTQPDFILQYAYFLKEKFCDTLLIFEKNKKFHLKYPSIHVESYVTLNGRSHRLFVDKKHDLSQIKNNLEKRTWLEKFE